MDNKEFMEIAEKVWAFHTKRAPGIPIATEMVLIAQRELGEKKIAAIAETRACLPDPIQVLTGCTIANGGLKMYDEIGRYALTLYNRKSGKGVRVYVDMNKIDKDKMPETYKFFTRTRDPELRTNMELRKASGEKVVEEFLAANRDIFTFQHVTIKDPGKLPVPPVAICEKCKESFTVRQPDDKLCLVCSGELAYYS